MECNRIYHEDCLVGMHRIKDKSIDMILTDLPYGTTRNKWDSPIPLEQLWQHYKRIIKDNGAIVLTAQTPFDKILGASNLDMLRYEWIWEKSTATGHLNANKMPMKAHENILVFYKRLPVYYPQKTAGHKPMHYYTKLQSDGTNYGMTKAGISGGGATERYPRSVLYFPTDKQKEGLHPTQKPVALFEYLIETYSKKGDIILDSCIGSGTTAIACMKTSRNYIGFENDATHYDCTMRRIEHFMAPNAR